MSAIRCVLLPACVLAAVVVLCSVSCRKADNAQQEVVLYTSCDEEIARPIIADFERQTGIKVLARFDSEADKTVGLARKLTAEKDRPAADVWWSNELINTIRLARAGLLEPYDSDGAKDRPSQYADPNGLWHGFALRARVIAYSTQRVKPQDAPKTLEDLLDPKWKGRFAMARPVTGTTVGDVSSWFAHYGPKRATEILQGLKANDVQLVQSNGQSVRMVANGQVDVAMTDTDDVYAQQRNGAAIGMNFLNQGSDGVLTIPNSAALVRGGPNPDAARKLVAFLLSAQVEQALAQHESRHVPVRPELLRELSEKYRISKPLAVSYDKVADHMEESLKVSSEILR